MRALCSFPCAKELKAPKSKLMPYNKLAHCQAKVARPARGIGAAESDGCRRRDGLLQRERCCEQPADKAA